MPSLRGCNVCHRLTRCSFAAPSAPSRSGASTASPATTTPLASTPLLPARSAGAPPPLMLQLHLGVEMTMLQLPPPSHGPRASSAEQQGLRNRCCQWRAVPQRVSGCRHEHLHRCARQRRLHRRGGGGGGALGAGFVALRSAARACLRQAQLSRRTRCALCSSLASRVTLSCAVCPTCMLQPADVAAYVTIPAALGADALLLWDSPDAHKP